MSRASVEMRCPMSLSDYTCVSGRKHFVASSCESKNMLIENNQTDIIRVVLQEAPLLRNDQAVSERTEILVKHPLSCCPSV
jgi:hypothetical protein